MAHLLPAETASPQVAADRWTAYSVTVWAICMLGFAFDIYEATIMQLVTPLLIKEGHRAGDNREYYDSIPLGGFDRNLRLSDTR